MHSHGVFPDYVKPKVNCQSIRAIDNFTRNGKEHDKAKY